MRPATKRKRVNFVVDNKVYPTKTLVTTTMRYSICSSKLNVFEEELRLVSQIFQDLNFLPKIPFCSGQMMTATSRTESLSDLLSFNPHSKNANNNNNNNNNNGNSSGTKHKLYNPVVTPDCL